MNYNQVLALKGWKIIGYKDLLKYKPSDIKAFHISSNNDPTSQYVAYGIKKIENKDKYTVKIHSDMCSLSQDPEKVFRYQWYTGSSYTTKIILNKPNKVLQFMELKTPKVRGAGRKRAL